MNTKNTVRILNEVLIRRHDSTQKLFNIFHDDKKKNLQTYYGKLYWYSNRGEKWQTRPI